MAVLEDPEAIFLFDEASPAPLEGRSTLPEDLQVISWFAEALSLLLEASEALSEKPQLDVDFHVLLEGPLAVLEDPEVISFFDEAMPAPLKGRSMLPEHPQVISLFAEALSLLLEASEALSEKLQLNEDLHVLLEGPYPSVLVVVLKEFDPTLGYPGEGPDAGPGGGDAEGGRGRSRSPISSSQHADWSVTAPQGRHIAICATCCSDIPPRMPRVRRGGERARVHHVGCVALQCGALNLLSGWSELSAQAKSVAMAQFDCSRASSSASASPEAPAESDVAMASNGAASQAEAAPAAPGPEERLLQRMAFWSEVPWRAMHDPIRSIDCVPDAAKPALAELRGSLAAAAQRSAGLAEEECYLKAFFFLDRLLFAAVRKQRGGARGQRGETVARTLARRIRMAWEGSWGALWEESNGALRRGGASTQPSEAQRLARDVKSVEEALADDDVREALRCVDVNLEIASDRKARRCLPALFPQAPAQPVLEDREPLDEDIERFLKELRRSFQFAPSHRAAGPGSGRNEHWSWMPLYEEAWEHIEKVLLRLALAKLPLPAMSAIMSAKVLAADRDEPDKVRPLALGVIHRRLVSKAVGRVFQARVAAAVGPREHSIGAKSGAELMHKSVLVELDRRDDGVKLSFDASNAHNEYDRTVAAECVREDVPDMLPWVRAPLSIEAVHEHVGMDGIRTEFRKTRGGDQGDALTALLFPLTYKRVSSAVQSAAAVSDPETRLFTFQDDMEGVCKANTITRAAAAYDAACARVGLRANIQKTKATPGRNVDVTGLPGGILIDARAVVLRHGGSTPVSALPANNHASGSQLAEGSTEVRSIETKRNIFYERLRKLRAAGLLTHSALALMRTRTAGDCTFVARACGIPARDAAALDRALLSEVESALGAVPGEFGSSVVGRKIFLRAADGGLGFQSVGRTSPAAYAASWHACLPKILEQLSLPGASALTAISPWAATCLPAAEAALREALGDHSINIGDSGVAASQHSLARAPHAAAARSVSDELAADNRGSAALRSAGGPGGGTWSNAPSLANQHLSNAQFAIALRTRLHTSLPQCRGQCQHRRQDGSICGADLDVFGFHARCCAFGGWLVRRHDAACAVLGDWCQDLGCQLEVGQKPYGEVLVPWAAPARPEARMDLVIRVPGVASPFYVDLTVASALSVEALRGGSAVRDGAAAGIAARGKIRDYPNCNVTPFVVEDHGRLGEDALRLIRLIAPTDLAERSRAIRRLHQSLGATLQRCAADAVIAATTARPSG